MYFSVLLYLRYLIFNHTKKSKWYEINQVLDDKNNSLTGLMNIEYISRKVVLLRKIVIWKHRFFLWFNKTKPTLFLQKWVYIIYSFKLFSIVNLIHKYAYIYIVS